MRLDRLFQVLVVGGAAISLSAGCDGGPGGGGTGGDGEGGASPTTSGDGGGDSTTSADGGGDSTTSAASGGAGGAGGGNTTTSDATGGAGGGLQCSEEPDPSDPCGCPCCWADNCANDDPACCGAFCEGTCC